MMQDDYQKQMNETQKKMFETLGVSNYFLYLFGCELADREGYKELSGIDAIQFYIMEKYRWLPSQVKSLSFEDMRFILTEEMSGWKVPQSERKNS